MPRRAHRAWIVGPVVLAALLCGIAPARAQDPAAEQLVARFFPERLLDGNERYACHQVMGGQDGAPELIVAAYTNRNAGAVRVLRRGEAGEFEMAFENPGTWNLAGRDCVVRLDDVDLDGAPEAFVYFFSNRSSSGWIFRWNGTTLENLTATEVEDGREVSIMLEPTVYDLTHEGGKRVVAQRDIPATAPGVRPAFPAYVYRLGEDGFEVESTALAVMGFRADVGAGANQRFFRLVTDSSDPITLRVINGERDGSARVTGATITVNNEVVLGPGQVNETVEFATVELPEIFVTNEVNAELTGPPEGRLIVIVEDATAR